MGRYRIEKRKNINGAWQVNCSKDFGNRTTADIAFSAMVKEEIVGVLNAVWKHRNLATSRDGTVEIELTEPDVIW